ncbi:cyclophilin-like fold protein [Isoptericola jiangsuensis]|uniref:cyclophilin-like fold protein n=1 Tax=Isoptericola jiangsuensis TaxID=548579 RepID=UPI003AAC4F93
MRLSPTGASAATAVALSLALAACGPAADEVQRGGLRTSGSVPPPSPSTPHTESADASDDSGDDVVGTVVRFSGDGESVEVTIGEDSPATRDFLSMLPLTLDLEEFNDREKIAYLPRELEHDGSPGSDPEDGDLIYYVPWGNLGFYYDTEGTGYSDDTLHLGTYDAARDHLDRLEGEIAVEVLP